MIGSEREWKRNSSHKSNVKITLIRPSLLRAKTLSLTSEKNKLEEEIERFKSLPKFKTITEKAGYFDDPFNKESKKTIWEIQKGSQWVDDGPDEKYHINMRIKKKKKKDEKKIDLHFLFSFCFSGL